MTDFLVLIALLFFIIFIVSLLSIAVCVAKNKKVKPPILRMGICLAVCVISIASARYISDKKIEQANKEKQTTVKVDEAKKEEPKEEVKTEEAKKKEPKTEQVKPKEEVTQNTKTEKIKSGEEYKRALEDVLDEEDKILDRKVDSEKGAITISMSLKNSTPLTDVDIAKSVYSQISDELLNFNEVKSIKVIFENIGELELSTNYKKIN